VAIVCRDLSATCPFLVGVFHAFNAPYAIGKLFQEPRVLSAERRIFLWPFMEVTDRPRRGLKKLFETAEARLQCRVNDGLLYLAPKRAADSRAFCSAWTQIQKS